MDCRPSKSVTGIEISSLSERKELKITLALRLQWWALLEKWSLENSLRLYDSVHQSWSNKPLNSYPNMLPSNADTDVSRVTPKTTTPVKGDFFWRRSPAFYSTHDLKKKYSELFLGCISVLSRMLSKFWFAYLVVLCKSLTHGSTWEKHIWVLQMLLVEDENLWACKVISSLYGLTFFSPLGGHGPTTAESWCNFPTIFWD